MNRVVIPCIPPKSTAQASSIILKRKDGSSFVGKAQSSKAKAAADTFFSLLYPHRPIKPMEGPVSLCVEIEWPWRSSEPKRNREHGYRFCDKRPDLDNYAKLFLDTMGRIGYWLDDGQIADLRLIKRWGDNPGITICYGAMNGSTPAMIGEPEAGLPGILEQSDSKAPFVPPTASQVRSYCLFEHIEYVDPSFFWNYFNDRDWIDVNEKPVRSWKGKIRQWEGSAKAKGKAKMMNATTTKTHDDGF